MPASQSTSSQLYAEENDKNYRKLLIVLAGPTAVGKSSVGAQLCSQEMATDMVKNHAYYNQPRTDNHDIDKKDVISKGHIISADSVQAYQGVQVGANKPTKEEMERTPHHLIDIVDGDSICQYNAADWTTDALNVIERLTEFPFKENTDNIASENSRDAINNEDILRRKNRIEQYLTEQLRSQGSHEQVLPVIVGGTMMYLQWLVHGRPDAMKPSNEAIAKAAKIIQTFQKQEETLSNEEDLDLPIQQEDSKDMIGWKGAIFHTSSLGPIFADRVSKLSGKDWYRLRRTLEVAYTVLDDPDNSIKIDELYNGQREGGLDPKEYDVRCFFLCPDDRMTHTSVVDSRCEDMIINGLIKETTDLSLSGLLPPGGQQARAIGYRQTLDYLNRKDFTSEDESSFASYLVNFTTATRRYAKKQMQWFRRDKQFVFVPVKLSDSKDSRVENSAKIIRDLCVLPREKFDEELLPTEDDDNKNASLSAKTKQNNEKQGKGMKYYIGKRHKINESTNTLKNVLVEADECTIKMQQLIL